MITAYVYDETYESIFYLDSIMHCWQFLTLFAPLTSSYPACASIVFFPVFLPSPHQPLPLTSSSFLLFSLDSSLPPTSLCPSTLPPSLACSSHSFLSLELMLLIRPSFLQSLLHCYYHIVTQYYSNNGFMITHYYECLVQVGNGIALDTVVFLFKPYWLHPCGVTCDGVPEQSL